MEIPLCGIYWLCVKERVSRRGKATRLAGCGKVGIIQIKKQPLKIIWHGKWFFIKSVSFHAMNFSCPPFFAHTIFPVKDFYLFVLLIRQNDCQLRACVHTKRNEMDTAYGSAQIGSTYEWQVMCLCICTQFQVPLDSWLGSERVDFFKNVNVCDLEKIPFKFKCEH